MRLHLGRLVTAMLVVVSGAAWGLSQAGAANLDEACGGPQKITCNSALYCQLPAGQCAGPDTAGTCVKAPDFCMRVSRPVCGCNGKTYANECEARKARVAIDTTGACKKPPAAEGAPAAKAKAKAKPAAKKKKKAAPPAQ